MTVMDWLSIIAIVFSVVAFIMSWKWASDSDRSLQEIRKVADDIRKDIDARTREIERRVEERTKDTERMVDAKTTNIERILEDRLRDLLDRAAPKAEDKVMNDVMAQMGPQIFLQAFQDPKMLKTLVELGNQSKK